MQIQSIKTILAHTSINIIDDIFHNSTTFVADATVICNHTQYTGIHIDSLKLYEQNMSHQYIIYNTTLQRKMPL